MYQDLLSKISKILRYPEEDYQETVLSLINYQQLFSIPVYEKLISFIDFVKQADIAGLEELYTSTFDLNPACPLEIGWHLFGEDYKRGEFLVHMRKGLRELNLTEGGELPDHLSNVVLFLSALEKDQAERFAGEYLSVSMDRIAEGIKNPENPYKSLLLSLRAFFQEIFQYPVGAVKNGY